MKRYFLVLFFTLAAGSAHAQNAPDQALLRRLQSGTADTIINLFDSLYLHAFYHVPGEEYVSYAQGTIRLAEASDINLARVQAYQGLGQLYFEHDKFGKALENYHRAYELAEAEGGVSKARISLAMAQFFTDRSLLPEAAEKAEESIAIADSLHHPLLLFKGLYLRALVHYRSGEFEDCIHLSKKAATVFATLQHTHERDRYEGISTYNTIGLCLARLQQIDSALLYLAKAETMARAMKIDIWVAIVRGHRAEHFLTLGRLPEARTEALYEFATAQRLQEWNVACQSALSLARIHIATRTFAGAERYLDSARWLLPRTHGYAPAAEYWETKHRYYVARGRYREALEALQRFDAIRDSTVMENEKANLKRLVAQYELQRKQREIIELISSNKLRDEQIARQNLERNMLIGSLVLFLLILTGIFMAFRSKQRTNRLLREHNEIIEAQSEELTVSLENLKATQEQLVQSEKMASLGQLTAGIAHELNNPLNFVAGGVDSLRNLVHDLKDQPPGRLAEAESDAIELLRIVSTGVQRMNKIISSLRTFSGLQQYAYEEIDIREPLEVALTILSGKFGEAGITVTKHFGPGLSRIHGSDTQLSQLFLNILENAAHALVQVERPREITITVARDGGKVLIAIADNGPGIPAGILHKIMDPFFTTREVGKGAGLGLSVSRAIVNNHNGTLNVRSAEGQGATFDVRLPVIRP